MTLNHPQKFESLVYLQQGTDEDDLTEQIVDVTSDTGVQNQNSNDITPSPTTSHRKPINTKRKRSQEAEEAYNVMKKLEANLRRDDCDVFGENVACQLREITDTRSRMVAKHRINQILFEFGIAQFDNEQSTSSSYEPSSRPTSTPSMEPMFTPSSSRPPSVNQDQPFAIGNTIGVLADLLGDEGTEEPSYTVMN